jgi:hypothetical protein
LFSWLPLYSISKGSNWDCEGIFQFIPRHYKRASLLPSGAGKDKGI